MSSTTTFSTRPTEFFGRTREREELFEATRRLAGGGRTFFLCGEPGIGKTALAAEVARVAGDSGSLIAWGRCNEDGSAVAYLPWLQILRSLAADDEAAWGGLVARLASSRPSPLAHAIDSEERLALYEHIADGFCEAARARSLVLLLDDLHAADLPSLLLLRAVAQRTRLVPILVVGTYRDVEMRRDAVRSKLVAECARHGAEITLSGLTPDDVRSWVDTWIAEGGNSDLAAEIYRRSDGNPLFVGELVRLWLTRGGTETTDEIPNGIREVILQRLHPLSESCRDILRIAAVLGAAFDLRILAATCGRPIEELTRLLDEARHGSLVVPASQSGGSFRFNHILTRDALYHRIPALERAGLHARAGSALAATDFAGDESALSTVAHHFVQAAVAGRAREAIDFSVRAGRSAMQRWAYEDAAIHFGQALATLDLGDTVDAGTRTELLLELAAAWRAAGDERSTAVADEAIEVARRLCSAGVDGAPELFARATVGWTDRVLGTPEAASDERAEALLREALQRLGDASAGLRARLLSLLAMADAGDPTKSDCEQVAEQAVAIARGLDDPMLLSITLLGHYFVLWRRSRLERRLSVGEEMLRVSHGRGDSQLAQVARGWHVLDLMTIGRVGAAEAELQRYHEDAEKLRQPRFLWPAFATRAAFALWRGRWATAIHLAEVALAHGQRVADPMAKTTPVLQRMFALRECGDLAGEEAMLRFAIERFPASPTPRSLLAAHLLDSGRTEEARFEFEELAAEDFDNLRREFRIGVTPVLAELCAGLADERRAAILYGQLLPLAHVNVPAGLIGFFGSGSRYLGLLAATLGRTELAVSHLSDALRENRKMGSQPQAAWVQHDLAAVMQHGRIRHHVMPDGVEVTPTRLLDQAAEVATRLGMTRLAAAIEKLRRTGLDATATPPPVSPQLCYWFRHEGEVWSIGRPTEPLRLRDSKGLRYLALLLRHPSREFHAFDLSDEFLLTDGDMSNLAPRSRAGFGPISDARARADYRDRLNDLREELAEASANNDLGRSQHLRAEMDSLAHQLASSLGLHGRERVAGSPAERARLNVTRAIKSAMRKIAAGDDDVGRYLETTVNTGTFCSYVPDHRFPVVWQL